MTEYAATAEPTTDPYRWRWAALFVILAVEVMDLLDSMIIGIAAPSIRSDLGGTYTSIQWLAAGYTLTMAIGLITGGRLGDIYGRRRMFVIGVVGFTLVSAMCGLAPSIGLLIGLRLVQGVFAAIMIPQGFGIIKTIFPPSEIGSAFGAFGPVIGLSAVLGPIVAGGLISADWFGTGWRMVFYINVPLGIAALVGAFKFLPESKSRQPLHLDLVGMVLVMLATVLLIFPLVQGRDLGWPTWTFVSMAACVPVFALFAWYEVRKQRRDASALVVPSLFRKRSFSAGLIVSLIFFAAMSGFMLVFGLFLQIGLGFSPLRAGLTFAPWALGLAIGAALSGAVLGPKYGRHVLHVGTVVMALGVAALYMTLHHDGTGVTTADLIPALLLSGFGMGMLLSPLFSIVLSGIEQDEVGSASGVLNANQQLGSTVGVAVIGTIFFALLAGQAYAAADNATAALRSRLTSAQVSVATQDQIVSQFRNCAHDRAAQKDPSAVPPSCDSAARAGAADTSVGAALQEAGKQASRATFVDAMERILLVVIGLLAIVFALAFMLPRTANPIVDHSGAPPVDEPPPLPTEPFGGGRTRDPGRGGLPVWTPTT